MTTRSDDGAVFDADLIQHVAEENDIEHEVLGSAIDEHQSSVASLPGVENLVYEWRKQYEAPVIDRTPDVYYVAVPDWVWSEFGDHLDLPADTLDALVDAHRQIVARETDAPAEPPAGGTYVALDRRRDET